MRKRMSRRKNKPVRVVGGVTLGLGVYVAAALGWGVGAAIGLLALGAIFAVTSRSDNNEH